MAFSFQSLRKDFQRLRFELGRGQTLFIFFLLAFFGIFLIIPILTILYWSLTSTSYTDFFLQFGFVSDFGNLIGYIMGDQPENFLFKPFLDIFTDENIWGGAFGIRAHTIGKAPLAALYMWIILGFIILLLVHYHYIRPRAIRPDSFLRKQLTLILWSLFFISILGFMVLFSNELKIIKVEPIQIPYDNPAEWGTKIILQGPEMGGLLNSIIVALSTTLLSTIFGLFFAFIMARYTFPGKNFFRPFLLLPLIIPPFVSIIGFHRIMGETGILNTMIYDAFNIRIVLGGSVGIVFVQFLHFYTLVYLNVYSSLVNIDPSLEESAENLGAKGLMLTRTITIPLAMPGLAAGAILTFILAIEDLGTPLIFRELQLGDPFDYMPTLIFRDLINLNPYAELGYDVIGKYAALSAILVIIAVIGFLLIRRFVSLRHYAMISKGRVGEPRTSPATPLTAVIIILVLFTFLPIALIPHIGTMIFGLGEDGFLLFVLIGGIITINFGIYFYLIKDKLGSMRIIGVVIQLLGLITLLLCTVLGFSNYLSTSEASFRTFLSYFGFGEIPSGAETFREGIVLSIYNMFLYSILATILIIIIATVTAYILARKNFPGKGILDSIVTLPLAIPGIIIGFGFFIMFYNQPLILPLQDLINIPLNLIDSLFQGLIEIEHIELNPAFNPMYLLILSFTVRKFTFTIRSAFAGMQQVDTQLEEASFNLGASRVKTLRSITIPLIAISVFAGGLISLVYCMSEVSTTIILLDYTFDKFKFGTATWKIWDIYGDPQTTMGYPMAAVLGVILMLIQATSIFITNVILKSRSEALTGI